MSVEHLRDGRVVVDGEERGFGGLVVAGGEVPAVADELVAARRSQQRPVGWAVVSVIGDSDLVALDVICHAVRLAFLGNLDNPGFLGLQKQ
ncbi:hypothetical protein [Streptomyces parvulus]